MFWNTKKFIKERLSLKMLKHSAPVLSPLVQEQVKQRVLMSIQNFPAAAPAQRATPSLRFHFAKLAASSAFGVLAIVGTAYASTASNPGDILYPVKRAQETVKLTLAPSEENKAQLQAAFARERIKEFKNVTKANSVKTTGAGQNNSVKNTAKKEVKNALQNLKTAEVNLQKQGKIKAAVSVQNNIKSINLEAKEQNLIEESPED